MSKLITDLSQIQETIRIIFKYIDEAIPPTNGTLYRTPNTSPVSLFESSLIHILHDVSYTLCHELTFKKQLYWEL